MQNQFKKEAGIEMILLPALIGSALGYLLSDDEDKLMNALFGGALGGAAGLGLSYLQPSLSRRIFDILSPAAPVAGGAAGYFYPEILTKIRSISPSALPTSKVKEIFPILDELLKSDADYRPAGSQGPSGMKIGEKTLQVLGETGANKARNQIEKLYKFIKEVAPQAGIQRGNMPVMTEADINKAIQEAVKVEATLPKRIAGGTAAALATPLLVRIIDELI